MNGIDDPANRLSPRGSSGTRATRAYQPLRPAGPATRAGLNPYETANLVEVLIELVNLTRRLESVRMDLACMPDFNLMDAFSIFDEEGEGYCSQD